MHHGVRTAVLAAVTVCYPLAVWLLRDRVAPRWFALLLMGVVALRWAGLRERAGWLVLPGAAIAGLAVATVWLGDAWPLRWYPVGVNLTLLASFAITLARPPSMAERFARLQAPDLPPFAAAFGTDAQWALYNGGVAYLLVGVLASTEYLVRRRVRARHAHG